MVERWAVIADDLTGALDTALQFRKAGQQTFASTRPGVWPSDGRVVAMSTETRHKSAETAAARVQAAFRALRRGPPRRVYKKTDSLLRGNIGAELRALRNATGAQPLVFAPAFPAGGRTTIDGIHRLNGVPVAQTAPGRDELTPVGESHIPTLLLDSAQLKVESVPLDVVRGDHDVLVAALTSADQSGIDVVVPDVETDDDLLAIASALRATVGGRISAGSAGLAENLARLDQGASQPKGLARSARVAAVVGTPSVHTQAQVQRALTTGTARLVRIRSSEDIRSAVRQMTPDRPAERAVIFDTTLEGETPRQADRRRQLALGGELCAALANAIGPLGLILTGGDTARAALGGLEVDSIEVLEEIEWGVPAGRALCGIRQIASVVTKGGTMGGPDALITAFQRLGATLGRAA